MIWFRPIHFLVETVCDHVSSEGDDGDTKTRKDVAEHCSVGKD